MTAAHLVKLWTLLAGLAVVWIGGSFLLSRGASDLLAVSVVAGSNPIVASYFGAVLGGLLLAAAMTIGVLYAKRHRLLPWHGRIPPTYLEGLDSAAPEAKVYLVVVMVLMGILPTLGAATLLSKAAEGRICIQDDTRYLEQMSLFDLLSGDARAAAEAFKPGSQLRLEGLRSEPAPPKCSAGVEVGWYSTLLLTVPFAIACILLTMQSTLILWPAPDS